MTSKSSDFDFSTTTQDNITKEDEKMNEKLASLSFDQIDIDDSEFSIPPLENPPTLESILNAPDYDDEEFRDLTDQFKVCFHFFFQIPYLLNLKKFCLLFIFFRMIL